jgi:hypothetical protein
MIIYKTQFMFHFVMVQNVENMGSCTKIKFVRTLLKTLRKEAETDTNACAKSKFVLLLVTKADRPTHSPGCPSVDVQPP